MHGDGPDGLVGGDGPAGRDGAAVVADESESDDTDEVRLHVHLVEVCLFGTCSWLV